MKKIWQKNNKNTVSKIVEKYCFSEGTVLDNQLITEDVLGSIAHAFMLVKIGILKQEEFVKLKDSLLEILKLKKEGKFVVTAEDEDVHTKVENYLTQKLGELGKKIHTGRSRNDQVLTDLRLFSKKNIIGVSTSINRLIEVFINFGKKYEFVPMPGYTHMQKAMPSSVGMWAGSFAESLIDDLELIKSSYQLNDQSPLGSGAAYGVSLPIDRNLTAKLLGFSKVQNNSLHAQISRPKIQLAIMQGLTQIMLTLSPFASDLLLFTTEEFNFFSVDESLCTGSSIMPQKKNLDVMEYLRAKTHVVINLTNTVAAISASLPSGYNADFAETKSAFFKAFEITNHSIKVVDLTLKSLKPNISTLKKACTPDLYATHAAYLLVKKGMPFREAYKKIGSSLNHLPTFNPMEVLKQTNHIGGPGNLKLDDISKINSANKKIITSWQKKFTETINNLKGGE